MSSFNVVSGGRAQVLVDGEQLQQLQSEAMRRGEELKRLQAAMETLSAVNAPAHFMAAAMALCNELASRWNAERVGVGFLKGRYVRLMALSHTEKITRHMQLVQDIEAGMEECLDQDVEIIYPPVKDASYVYRSTETLAVRNGPNAVVSFPLRRALPANKGERAEERYGNVVAVMTVERKADKPFTLNEIETLRLTSDLFTARLVDLYEHDRWVGAKALKGTRRGLAFVVGAKHTWAKVFAIAAAGLIAFAVFVDGTFKVEAPFVFEASEKQILAAPFDSSLKTVHATVGDAVFSAATGEPFDDLNAACTLAPILRVARPVTVLATLNTSLIEPQLDSAEWERRGYLQQAQLAAGQGKEGERQMALAQAEKSAAEARRFRTMMDESVITSPVDGVILSGDLRTKIGAPVKPGDELFQVGQLDKIRAELSVPEDQVSELAVGMGGELKTTSYPDQPIKLKVERITPVAAVTGQKNVFKIRAALEPGKMETWMRPGVEGLAKVEIRKARYGWIWTHRLVNWVRMKVWM